MKKPIKIILRILASIFGLFVILCIIGIIVGGGEASPPSPKTKPQKQQAIKTEPEPQEQPVIKTEPEPQGQQATQVMPDQQQSVPVVSPKPTTNLLLKARLIEAPVANGFGERIGTRAYITIPREVFLETVTLDDVAEFYKSFQGKGYNWVSVICPEDKTGLVFPGGTGIATYAKIDEFGRQADKARWTIIYDESIGTFKKLEL